MLTSILSNLNNFYPIEVVDRVSERQFQAGEKLQFIDLVAGGYNVNLVTFR